MLRELKNLEFPGGKNNILYFLCNIIGDKAISSDDVKLLCSHAFAGYKLYYPSLMAYCENFGWISIDRYVVLESSLLDYIESEDLLNDELIRRTVKFLFESGVFRTDMFSYDIEECRTVFHNERLSLYYSSVRNMLISQGFLDIEHQGLDEFFYVNEKFESIVSKYSLETERAFTLEQLKEKLEQDAITGEKAEKYALSFEKRRITNPELVDKIRLISDIDVSAGYDMISFETNQSTYYDRFIEVKAVSKEGFFWSANEYNVAKYRGDHYYLYLINLSKISNSEYAPMIICNPANELMESGEWLIEPQSYHIRKI